MEPAPVALQHDASRLGHPRTRDPTPRGTTPLPKLVESSALDAVDAGQANGASGDRAAAQRFLDMVGASELKRFPAIGEGEDLRLVSPSVAGGGARGSRIVRASQRRSGRQ